GWRRDCLFEPTRQEAHLRYRPTFSSGPGLCRLGQSLRSRGKCDSGRPYLVVPSWRRLADRFCLRLRPPGIPHLRAPAITLAHRTPLNSHDHLERSFSFIAMKDKITQPESRIMKNKLKNS